MGRGLRGALVGALLVAVAAWGGEGHKAPARAADDDQLLVRRDVDRFVLLPEGVRFPEGVTANPANGDVYVGTFDVPSASNATPKNRLLRYDRHGELVASHDFGNTPLLGLAYDGWVVAKLGEFLGIRRDDGTPDGLLFPASLAIVDDDMFVTNLAVPITDRAGDEPEEDVRRWTISHVKLP